MVQPEKEGKWEMGCRKPLVPNGDGVAFLPFSVGFLVSQSHRFSQYPFFTKNGEEATMKDGRLCAGFLSAWE
jgi:hypothetical protein